MRRETIKSIGSAFRVALVFVTAATLFVACGDDSDGGNNGSSNGKDAVMDAGVDVDENMDDDTMTDNDAMMDDDAVMDEDAAGNDAEQQDAGGSGGIEPVSCGEVEADKEISINNFSFNPSSVSISPGTVVQWTNNDSAPHTVTSGTPDGANAGDKFDSGNLSSGSTYCLKFDNDPGTTFVYYCELHPEQMRDAEVEITE